MGRPSSARNIAGERFGRLVALECKRDDNQQPSKWIWVCRCDCGKTHETQYRHLIHHKAKSCGCLHLEKNRTNCLKHGHSSGGRRSLEAASWNKIIQRCTNPNDDAFANYGGRGIQVCERWRHSLEAFIADMGPRPSRGHSIERNDTNGNYEPGNCRWATKKEQQRNRRVTVYLDVDGDRRALSAWAEAVGLPYNTVSSRVRHGWAPKEALGLTERKRAA